MTMAETTQFTIGAEVSCSDGLCGEVTRVVVDPVAQAVTHLVVEQTHRQGLGRLVPLSLVSASAGEIRLGCTTAEFDKLDSAEETQFVPGSNGYAAYGPQQVFTWPYYGLGTAGLGMGAETVSQTITYDKIPLGEVAVRRGEHVHATDGDIGRVQGLVIDPSDHHVTHVLLEEGHLWGRKEVAIPISAVTVAKPADEDEPEDETEASIQLSITKQEVQELPAVDIGHLDG
jgi:sporulation protein YlmC with PRC-barrel domain